MNSTSIASKDKEKPDAFTVFKPVPEPVLEKAGPSMRTRLLERVEEYRDGADWILAGAITLEIVWIISSVAAINVSSEDELSHLTGVFWLAAELANLIDESRHELFAFGFGLIAFGLIFAYIGKTARKVWSLSKPGIDRQIASLRLDLMNEIRTSKLPLVIKGSSESEAKELIINMISRAYGEHCMRENSLPRDVLSRFELFFDANKPYAADHSRVITLTNDATGNKHWNELTTYTVRCTSLEEAVDPLPSDIKHKLGKFEIKYDSSSLVDPTTFNASDYSLKLCWEADQKKVFDFATAVQNIDGVWSSKDRDWTIKLTGRLLTVEFKTEVVVDRSATRVTVEEKSIIAPEDDLICLQYPLPCLRASIVIHLPDDTVFIEKNFNTYGTPNLETWSVTTHPTQTLIAQSGRWIPPGVCCAITYRKEPPPLTILPALATQIVVSHSSQSPAISTVADNSTAN